MEVLAGDIPISINKKQHALGTRTDGWQANGEKSELIISNITLGLPSPSVLKLLKAEKCSKILEERKHLFAHGKKMQEYTIFFIYGLISLLIQEIFAYTYIIFPIKDFGKM